MFLPKSGLCGCEGEGGSNGDGVSLPTLTNPAGAKQIVEGYESINGSGVKITGEMPVNAVVNKELSPGDSYVIPEGYHDGTGVVYAKFVEDGEITLPSLTNPAGAEHIMSGYESINGSGVKITGTHVCESSESDFDPNDMEENEMLNLTGYTYVGKGDEAFTLEANTTYIILSNTTNTPVTAVFREEGVTGGTAIRAYLEVGNGLKVNFPENLDVEGDVNIWKKN